LEKIQTEPHTRSRYFCSPHHQESALYPFIIQLERAAGLERHDTVEQKLGKMNRLPAAGDGAMTKSRCWPNCYLCRIPAPI